MLPPTRHLLLTLVAALALTPALLASDASAAVGWRAAGALAVPRFDHTATALRDGTVLVAGGRQRTTTDPGPEASAELYDPATGAWSTVGPMASARYGHTATLLDGPICAGAMPPTWCGKVLVAGGTAAQPASAELYDPRTRSWIPTGPLIAPRRTHTATALANDGTVLVAGGETPTGTPPSSLSSAELYDPAAGIWSATGPLADARAGHSAILLPGPDGRALAAGGYRDDRSTNSIASAEVYNPATRLWSSAGSLTVARSEATATLLPDGRPLFAGGFGSQIGPRRSTEIYAESAPEGPWIDGGSMNVGRNRHTATVLPDSTTLVAGGGSSGLASTELYDARTATWSAAAPLAAARARHTATLLGGPRCASSCGDVLVVGGRAGINPLASAELYGPLPPAPPASVPTAPTGPPGRVTDLSAKALSARRIRLSFSAPGSVGQGGPPANRYLIKQSRRPLTAATFSRARSLCKGGVCRLSPRAIGQRMTLTVNGLAADRRYHYALRAIDGAGNRGPVSNAVRARTRKDRIRPGRVKTLSARGLSRKVRLRFRAPASDQRKGPPVRRFVIKQSTRPIRGKRGFRRARSVCRKTCRLSPRRVGAKLTLTVTGLCTPGRYYYAIRAIDEGRNLGPTSKFRSVIVKRSGRARGSCRRR